MTGSAADSKGEQSGLGPFAVGVVAMLAAGLLADKLRLGSYTATAIMGIAGMAPNAAALLLRRRRIGRDQRLEALSRGDLARPPLLVIGVLSSALWLANSLFSFIEGFVAGYSVAVTGGDPGRILLASEGLSWWVGAPLLVCSTYLLARYAAHHLARHATLWLAAAVGLFAALGLLTDTIGSYVLHVSDLNPTPEWIAANAVLLALLVIVSWLGKRRADSTHSQFVVVRLFRQLGASDRAAALELLREAVLTRASAQPEAAAPLMRSTADASGPAA